MRVLWLCGIVLPFFCDEFGFKKPVINGWLSGVLDYIKTHSNIKLGVCCPIHKEQNMKDGKLDNIKYYSFKFMSYYNEREYNQKEQFIKIIKNFNPDIIHIWGTEYIHTYNMLCAAEESGLLDRTIINIQGLISSVMRHYCDGLEEYDELQSIKSEILKEKIRVEYEIASIKKCRNISGRTEWDRACVTQINKSVRYWNINEILRDIFYQNIGRWKIENCNRHSIFLSHIYCPIKGLHYFLKAMPYILNDYPNMIIRIAGNDITYMNDGYGKYIKRIISDLKLERNIKFLGKLSEEEMCKEYMSANIFVCPSSIENSSNSVCEAMLIGTPVISSYVGGLPSLITHGLNGFLYQSNEPEMLAFYIKEIFENTILACELSKEATFSMSKKMDIEKNGNEVLKMYAEIANK